MKRKNILPLLCVVISVLSFLYNVSLNFTLYMKGSTFKDITFQKLTKLKSPPVIIVCPDMPYNPEKLLKFGLDTNVTKSDEMENNIKHLKGLNQSLEVNILRKEASWNLGEIVKYYKFGSFRENFTINTTESKYWQPTRSILGLCFNFMLPSKLFEYKGLVNYHIHLRKTDILSECSKMELLVANHPCHTSLGWREYKKSLTCII